MKSLESLADRGEEFNERVDGGSSTRSEWIWGTAKPEGHGDKESGSGFTST